MSALDNPALCAAVEANRYVITQHAQQRMGSRRVSHDELKYVIVSGDVRPAVPE
jgi:hypothetical protein